MYLATHALRTAFLNTSAAAILYSRIVKLNFFPQYVFIILPVFVCEASKVLSCIKSYFAAASIFSHLP
jgi:hypothetical protein